MSDEDNESNVVVAEEESDLNDLDDELANLDIDNDFNLDFADDDDDDDDDDVPKKKDCTNPEYAQLQLQRDEVFSHHYKPTKEENSLLKTVCTKLGAKNFGAPTTLLKLLNLQEDDLGKSILLKRGLLIINGQKRELVLFTHGFVVARPLDKQASGLLRVSLLVSKMYDEVHLYNDISWVKDLWQLQKFVFSVKTPSGELKLECDSAQEKQEWLQAWERVLLKNRTLQKSTPAEREARTCGWQHELLQTSLYTAACTGQAFFAPHHLTNVDTLDEYNGLAPLHYAALHNQVHIIQHLVDECEANVEVKDQEGRTPMYYAERDNWKPAIQALRDGGAEDSAAFETERHGALVEEARELEEKHQTEELFRGRADQLERRRSWMDVAGDAIAGLDQEQVDEAATTQQGKAQQAHSHMKDATNAIHERGHKINQLGSKASDLDNNAGEYKDLAAKVRQKLENKNKGLNFLNPFSGR